MSVPATRSATSCDCASRSCRHCAFWSTRKKFAKTRSFASIFRAVRYNWHNSSRLLVVPLWRIISVMKCAFALWNQAWVIWQNRSVSYHLVWKISDLQVTLRCCWEVLNCEGKSWVSRTAKGSARSSSPCFAKNLPFSSPQATRKKSIVLSKILQFYTHYLLNAVQNQLNSKRTLYASY